MSQVILYQYEPSFYSQIARLALVEKGVQWTEKPVNIGPVLENYEPWYMRVNPRGVIPTLSHDGEIVTDAFRIIRYVDERFDGPSLQPEELSEREKMDAWLNKLNEFPEREFSYSVKLGGLGGLFISRVMSFSYIRRRKVLSKLKAKHPDLAEHYDYRLKDIDTWENTCKEPQSFEKLLAWQERLLDELEQDLQNSTWCAGQNYSLADVAWTIYLSRLAIFDKTNLWTDGRRPNVAQYFDRLKARESFNKADVCTKIRRPFMFRMAAPFVLPRFAAAFTLLTLLFAGIWVMIT